MDKKKTAAAAALAAAAAAGMVTGALFDSPADLLAEPDAVVETLADDDDAGAPDDEERQRTPVQRLRQWVLSLPSAVRMLVGVPLWCLGWVLLTGLSTLWMGASPLLAHVAGWLCLAVILLAVFALTVKAAFPDIPFRRILRPRNVLFLLLTTLLLAAADLALPTVWEGYDAISRTVWRVGASCLLLFVCCAALGKHGKRPAPAEKEPVELTQEEVRERARQLADSVCPRR